MPRRENDDRIGDGPPQSGNDRRLRLFYCTDRSGATRELPPLAAVGVFMGYGYIASLAAIWVFGRKFLDRAMDGESASALVMSGGSTSGPLQKRLIELTRARNAGLITRKEFEQKKKKLLDDF